jgi:hypothetical protein
MVLKRLYVLLFFIGLIENGSKIIVLKVLKWVTFNDSEKGLFSWF